MKEATWPGTDGKPFYTCRAALTFVLILPTVFILVLFSDIDFKDLGRFFVGKRLVVIKEFNANETPILKTSTKSSDISEEQPVPGEKHIIFLETRCLLNQSASYNHSGLLLHPRQACSLESAARMNPDYKVYLLYSCPVIGGLEDSEEYVKAGLAYPNVKLWRLDITRHFSNTPLENWDFHAAILSSQWPNEHASDVLRYLTLWKYGGTYMDLDIIVLKSIDELGTNYVGLESSAYVASCVLSFAHEGIGHDVATMCANELRDNFRGDVWIHNGPGLITRVMLKICGVSEVPKVSTQNCNGFKILSDEEFFPIPYQEWRKFFDVSESNKTLYRIRNSYGVHFWNKMSIGQTIEVGSKQPFSIMAQHSCPRLCKKVGDSM